MSSRPWGRAWRLWRICRSSTRCAPTSGSPSATCFASGARSFVGVISVAFGVVALLLAAGFIEWIYWAMREDTIRSGLGHIQVVRKGYLDAGQADPFAFVLPSQAA